MRKIVFALTLCFPLFSNAQNFCGTVQSEADLAWLRAYQSTYTGGSTRGGMQYIPLSIHIVGDDEGTGYIRASQVMQDVCDLNEQYTATGFFFYIEGDIEYINNSTYYEHDFSDGGDMMDDYNIEGTVNMYFVGDPAGNCGYYSPGGNAVAIANMCGGNGNSTIAHEIGHFFSLPHTFYGWEYGIPSSSEQERVDGSNCNSAADGFCDTPPDYEADRWYCSSAPVFTDLDGVEFTPDGTLFMSYADDACANRFSDEQMDAMNSNLSGPRHELLSHPAVEFTDVDSSAPVSPEDGADYQYPNHTMFTWEPVDNVRGYILQIGFTPTFSSVIYDMFVTDTFFLADALLAERTYYWRVKTVGEANTCEGFSDAFTFKTGAQYLSAEDIADNNSFVIYPNPVNGNDQLTLDLRAWQYSNSTISITDLTGKVVAQEIISAGSTGIIKMELPQLADGMYLVSVSDGIHSEVKKLMVSE